MLRNPKSVRQFKCSNQGFYRYWTPELKELILELSKAESEKESKLKAILQNLIQLFVEHHTEWRQLVSVVAGNASCNIVFLSSTLVLVYHRLAIFLVFYILMIFSPNGSLLFYCTLICYFIERKYWEFVWCSKLLILHTILPSAKYISTVSFFQKACLCDLLYGDLYCQARLSNSDVG